MKVLIKTPLSPYSGYGNDGIGIVEAMLDAGLDVYLDPTAVVAPLPKRIADLLTKRLEAPFDLLLHHSDPGTLGISPEARRSAKTTVAWTMWEYATVDNLKGRSTLRKRLSRYDLTLGYDTVTTEALAPHVSKTAGTLQGGFWPAFWTPQTRDWNGTFRFCMVGQLHQRKDPFCAIHAFKELKDEGHPEFVDTELNLKTNVPGLHPAMESWIPGLRVFYEMWPAETLRDFYARQHVLLAPSRGEGKNVPALEFMSTGGTVIATNWGGHRQWLSSAYAYPLAYSLAAHDASIPNCVSARASKEHLKKLMLHAVRNRTEVRDKGAQAARLIPEMCSWKAVLARLLYKLGELPDGDRYITAVQRIQQRDREPAGV